MRWSLLLHVATVIFALCLLCVLPPADARRSQRVGDDVNDRPVVGVLTQPMSDSQPDQEILVASYVKFLESAGCRVVPLRFTDSFDQLKQLFIQVNGLFFPGGLASIQNNKFADAARYLLSLAINANQQGDAVPVWGTCLGFEQLLVYLSDQPFTNAVLSPVEAENIFLPLMFQPDAFKSTQLLQQAPSDVIQTYANQNITINMHAYAVLLDTYNKNPTLQQNFHVLTTSFDAQQPNPQQFLSLVEHRAYPIFGSQFHPEKNVFEWSQGHPDQVHTAEAVRASLFLAQRFVQFCRQNAHQFASEDELSRVLIYNYQPQFTGVDDHVEQTYFF